MLPQTEDILYTRRSHHEGDEIHFKDTMQELLSLSDRFGLTVTYQKPDKKIYLDVVEKLAKQYELKTPIDEVLQRLRLMRFQEQDVHRELQSSSWNT